MDKEVLSQLQALPDPRYLRFCERYLLPRGASRVDPFSIMIPDTCLSKAYVYRAETDIIRAVLDSLSPVTFMLAPYGRGKTTFMRVVPTIVPFEQALVVVLPVASAIGRLPNTGPNDSNVELHFRETLLRSIFGAFWDLVQKPEKRRLLLFGRRQDRSWMNRLRWFYQHLIPVSPQISEDFELMAWLRSRPRPYELSTQLSWSEQLHELVDMITCPPQKSYGPSPSYHHQRVLVLIDSGDGLSSSHYERLIQEVFLLASELPETCQLILLLDSSWESQIVKDKPKNLGGVVLFHLPSWTEEELKELLRLRLVARGQDTELPTNWGSTLLSGHLRPDAQRAFVDEIASSARKAAEVKSNTFVDAPIHALWLTRWVVTRLATEDPNSTPVSLETVRKHIGQYLNALQTSA